MWLPIHPTCRLFANACAVLASYACTLHPANLLSVLCCAVLQSNKEAEACMKIREQLFKDRCAGGMLSAAAAVGAGGWGGWHRPLHLRRALC